MNLDGLKTFFAEHRTAVLGAGAAGVAGLALMQRKKAAAADTTAGASVPLGTMPAGGVVSGATGGGGGYDSTNYDLYSALQPELEAILQQTNNAQTGTGGVNTAPPPVKSPILHSTPPAPKPAPKVPLASKLFGPSASTRFVHFINPRTHKNMVDQIQADGSLYNLSTVEYQALHKKLGSKMVVVDGHGTSPRAYTLSQNLRALQAQPKKPPAKK